MSRRILVLAAILVLLSTIGCTPIADKSAPPPAPTAQSGGDAAQPRKGGHLTLGHSADINGFDPTALPTGNWPMFNLVYDPVIRLDEKNQPQPMLAESWKFTSDGLTLTLNLRKGVLFHSGREMTADDVIFNIKRIQDPKVASNLLPLAASVKSMTAPDKYTVNLAFDKPFPAVFDLLDQTFVIDKDFAATIKQKGVGTGPFKLVKWVPGDAVELERNDKYWMADRPYLDAVTLKVIPDQAAMAVNLESGAVDVLDQPAPPDFIHFRDQTGGKFKAIQGPLFSMVQDLEINTTAKPFDDVRVRRALNYAINRDRYLQVALSGLGVTACEPFPSESLGYASDLAGACTYDVAKAKSLLADAGYPNGFEATIYADSGSAPQRQMVDLLMADLGQIGIKLKPQLVDQAAWRKVLWASEFQLIAHNYGRGQKDPDSLFRSALVWYTKGSSSKFESPDYTQLVDQAGSTLDSAKRKSLYAQLDKMIIDQSFTIPVATQAELYATSAKVHGLQWNREGQEIVTDLWMGQ